MPEVLVLLTLISSYLGRLTSTYMLVVSGAIILSPSKTLSYLRQYLTRYLGHLAHRMRKRTRTRSAYDMVFNSGVESCSDTYELKSLG